MEWIEKGLFVKRSYAKTPMPYSFKTTPFVFFVPACRFETLKQLEKKIMEVLKLLFQIIRQAGLCGQKISVKELTAI